MKKNFTLNYQW